MSLALSISHLANEPLTVSPHVCSWLCERFADAVADGLDGSRATLLVLLIVAAASGALLLLLDCAVAALLLVVVAAVAPETNDDSVEEAIETALVDDGAEGATVDKLPLFRVSNELRNVDSMARLLGLCDRFTIGGTFAARIVACCCCCC